MREDSAFTELARRILPCIYDESLAESALGIIAFDMENNRGRDKYNRVQSITRVDTNVTVRRKRV